ncbi:MAG: GNAT family N-acetyltransferase [Nocardioidaceae bacterium]
MTGEVRLDPMTPAEHADWSEHSVRGFTAQQVAVGLQAEPEALAAARRELSALLPDGLDTAGHHLWTVRDGDGDTVGHLWLWVRALPTEVEAYVLDIEILAAERGRGLGRATMLAVAAAALAEGATVLRLNVFGHNVAARRLYAGLGFVVTEVTMTRRLGPAGQPADEGVRVGLRDMTTAEYAVFRADHAADDLDRILPDGPATGGHRLWTAYDGHVAVGRAWLHLQHRSDGVHGFGHELRVHEELRRRGYGRSMLAAVEQECRALGVATLTLSRSGGDVGERSSWAQRGFELTAQTMERPL